MGEYFPKLTSLGGKVKVELDLPNYATKVDLKYATDVDTSTCLNSLKSKVEKLDVDKVVSVPVDLSKLTDVVKNAIQISKFGKKN